MIKLETIRYFLSLTGKEKFRVWKNKSRVFIDIENWTTPKYYLLTALRHHGYKILKTDENLIFEIIKE